LQLLGPLGIDAHVLSEVAQHMTLARRALGWQTFLAARDLVQIDAGAVVLHDRKLRLLPDEIQRRLLMQAVNWVSGTAYPARRGAIANLTKALRRDQGATVDGVHMRQSSATPGVTQAGPMMFCCRPLPSGPGTHSSPRPLPDGTRNGMRTLKAAKSPFLPHCLHIDYALNMSV
jgi:hypothetical protein